MEQFMSILKKWKEVLFAKKNFDNTSVGETKLSRVLNLVDLSFLGVSCTLGSGIYVLAGTVIGQYSGPGVIISFLISGAVSFLSGLNYAELGSRVPRSGSAYVYIYVTIGEFIGFIIGWDVILEYVIGTSSTASALSNYIDALSGKSYSTALTNAMPMNSDALGPYPDWMAFGFSIVITGFLIIGVRESSFLNALFTIINLIVILFIIIAGAVKSNVANWKLDVSNENLTWLDYDGNNQTCNSTDRCGTGGFFPFGFPGIISGTAKCFYAFIGFDVIATTGEEVINAKRNIPLSIIITLVTVATCYVSTSLILSLMIPYYQMDLNVPFLQAFQLVNLTWASYIVSIGAIISLATCLYASMFPMPRVVYSMASDGVIFKVFAYVMPKLKTPVVAAATTGFFSAVLALLFNLNELINMMSIGTLLAYAMVSACNLVLRYRPFEFEEKDELSSQKKTLATFIFGYSDEPILKRLFFPASKKCNRGTSQVVNVITITNVVFIAVFSKLLSLLTDCMGETCTKTHSNLLIIFASLLAVPILIFTFITFMQPQNKEITTFKTPLMPFFPLLAVFFNLYLMCSLDSMTWIRFMIWFVAGLVIYFLYGIRKSNERINRNQKICTCITFYENKTKKTVKKLINRSTAKINPSTSGSNQIF